MSVSPDNAREYGLTNQLVHSHDEKNESVSSEAK